ncbi:MAG TPA: hypothetical protein VHA74_02425 [Candidatus Dojkabacteria bacterium]|nr:hypothetical protein [Candidatus Dojkabacteria bacterium]
MGKYLLSSEALHFITSSIHAEYCDNEILSFTKETFRLINAHYAMVKHYKPLKWVMRDGKFIAVLYKETGNFPA